MGEFEKNPMQLERDILGQYLEFSEKYLEQLIESNATIKDKEQKILKIANYN